MSDETQAGKPDRSLLNEPIPGLIRKLAVPASVGYVFNTLYNQARLEDTRGIWWGIFGINWLAAGVAFVYARRLLLPTE